MSVADKSWIRLGGLLLLVVGMALVGCAGDDGKDGTDGADGTQGPTGPEGPPGTATCMNCHTDSWDLDHYILTKQTEYATSQHGTGETWVRKGDPCSRCHTTEGFQAYVNTGVPEAVSNSSRIGCFACHAPHTNENFDLRASGAVTLEVSGGTYDKKNSNTCANCHQARTPDPAIASADSISSPYWGAHHGPQSNILSGQGCWEFGGAAYAADHMHNTSIEEGCVNCHMADPPGSAVAGGHSWWITYEYHGAEEANTAGCVLCHPGLDGGEMMEKIEEAQAEFQTDMDTLKELLMAAGWIDDSNHVITATQPTAADDRGAVFNYNMLREDRSGGVHNPVYTRAVLDATLAHMQPKLYN